MQLFISSFSTSRRLPLAVLQDFNNKLDYEPINIMSFAKKMLPYYDEKDNAKLESLMEQWWNPTGPAVALHTMNKIRVPFIKTCLEKVGAVALESVIHAKPFERLKILDVGCGGGILTEALAEFGGTVHGIDGTAKFISTAIAHKNMNPSLENLEYFVTAIEDYSNSHFEEYDVMVLSQVIEHVVYKDSFLRESLKCLKPGGSIFVTSFNQTTLSWLIGILYTEYIIKTIPRGTHEYYKFTSPENVEKMLGKYNCKTVEVKGFRPVLTSANWRWHSNTTFNYALHGVKNKE